MAFVDRKKQAHLWRGTPATNPHPTPEQVVTNVLKGVVTGYADKAIVKAFGKMRLPLPDSLSHLLAETAVDVGAATVQKVMAARASKPKAKRKAKAKAAPKTRVNG